MKRIWILILAVSLLLSACGTESAGGNGLETHEGWTHPAAQGASTAVYFALHDHSSQADELIGASTEVAEAVKLQESPTNQVESLPVKAFADMAFGPGGPFLMLVNLKKDLKSGDQFEIILHFKNSGDIKARVSVRDTPPPAEE